MRDTLQAAVTFVTYTFQEKQGYNFTINLKIIPTDYFNPDWHLGFFQKAAI